MKFTTNKKKTSVEFEIEFNSEDFEPARLKALARLAQKVKIPGFRNGKAPANLVEQHVDPNELSSLTLDIMVRTAIPKVYQEAKLQPISTPNIEVKKFIPGEMAEITLTSDIMPDIKLPKYTGLKAKYDEKKIEAKDVDDVLNRIAESFAESKVVKRAAKSGDDAVIDFTGKKDGVAFEGGSAKDFRLRLGSGQFIPGFEDGVIGHEVGDKFELKLKFPKEYHSVELAGKPVVFEVLLKQVNEIVIPKIDDELAKKTGAFPTLKELKADIKKNLTDQAKYRAEESYKDAILEEIVDGVKADLPEAIVKEQEEHIKQDMEANLRARNAKLEDYLHQVKQTKAEWEKEVNEAARRRVIGHIIIVKIAEELKVKVSDDEVKEQVAAMQHAYKKDQKALEQLQTPEAVASIRNRILVNKTMDELVKLNLKK